MKLQGGERLQEKIEFIQQPYLAGSRQSAI